MWVRDLGARGRQAGIPNCCQGSAGPDRPQSESRLLFHELHASAWPAQHLTWLSYVVTRYTYFTVHMSKNLDKGVSFTRGVR